MKNALYTYECMYNTYALNICGPVLFYGIPTIAGYLKPNSLYAYISNIYGLVWFYGISTIAGYLKPNSLSTYISNIYGLVCFLWHINYCRLSKAIFSLHVHIKYIWFGLFFYGISTIAGYLKPYSLYMYISNI